MHASMTLDGFIAGPDDEMSWLLEHRADTPPPEAIRVKAATGAILCGRRGFDLDAKYAEGDAQFAEPFGGGWSGPIFILTHHPEDVGEHPDHYRFVSEGIEHAVTTALAAADGKDLLIISAQLARQALAAGLVDRIILHIAPQLLGDGIRLFETLPRSIRLDTVSVAPHGSAATVEYTVRRAS